MRIVQKITMAKSFPAWVSLPPSLGGGGEGSIRDSSNDGTSNRPRFLLFPSWAFSTCFSILSHQPMDSFTSYSSKEEKTPRSKGILLCLQTEVNNVLACARLWRGKRILSRLLSSFLPGILLYCVLYSLTCYHNSISSRSELHYSWVQRCVGFRSHDNSSG